MKGLVRLAVKNLEVLKSVYKIDWPLHVVSYAAIDHFIDRFRQHPSWEENVKFWTLNDEWRQSGTFVMENVNDGHILFNTFQSWPHRSLRKLLESLNYEQEKVFVCFNDEFRSAVKDIIRVRNLEVTFDSGAKLVYLPKEKLDSFDLIAPEGFFFDSVKLSNVSKINSVWAQRSKTSKDLLTKMVTFNPSTGLYSKENGKLISWCLMLETGAMGNLQVDPDFHKKGLGEITFKKQAWKMGRKFNRELCGFVAHHNKISFSLCSKIGFENVGNQSFIGVKPRKENPKLVPFWGRI